MKKVLSLVLALCMMLAIVPVVQADEPFEISLNGEWDFKYYENAKDVPEDVTKIAFEDKIQVPGAMELKGYGYPSYYYEEVTGWGMPEDDGVRSAGVYKLDFSSQVGYSCLLCFDNVRDDLTVYINGEKAGESKNGSVGSVMEVPVKKGTNTIVCVVKRDNSGINKKDDFALSGLLGNVTLTNGIAYKNAKGAVEVKDNTLTIEGKKVVLKGVKYTPTHPESGNSLTNEQIDKDLELIKEYGFNTVWVSAAPEYFYAKAEKLGLYVIDEANVNLSYADRDMETAKARIKAMIEKHSYSSVIMWSVGSGEGNSKALIDYVKELDNRPVAQEVNFAPDFKVFGNTGGMSDWVKTLGDGNVGGFVDEFADKELYYTQNAYLFDVKDTVTGETVTVDGEVENYKGEQYLGDASFVRNLGKMDKYTIVTELSAVEGDRVIFESGNVKFEVRGGRARFNVGNARARADVSEGKVAAVYRDGEIQIFVNNGFAENAQADAKLEGEYKIGGGETAIKYVEIYNDALTLDELLEGADKSKLISRVAFDDIDIKEDKSYSFLAYGGDFGDNPNSYYKCLTGIFSSTREPHPEAEAFKALFENKERDELETFYGYSPMHNDLVKPAETENGFVFEASDNKFIIDREGRIISITEKGNELLTGAIYPTFVRENTLNEYEMGVENEDRWKAVSAEVKGAALYVTLKSLVTEANATIKYAMFNHGFLYVSTQAEFADEAVSPTFIGFRGTGKFDEVEWYGYETSSYPDRKASGEVDLFRKAVSDMGDNYAVPQENGNKEVSEVGLMSKTGNLVFKPASEYDILYCQVLDYSPGAMNNADHNEDVQKDGNTYFRIGGFIKGLSGDNKYALNENVYGYNFFIGTDLGMEKVDPVREIFIDGEELTAFAPHIETYVYRTNKGVKVDGAVQDDKKAVIGDYTVYFAPATEYMSDMAPVEKSAEIAKDKDFNGNVIAMSNDMWSAATVYDKGISLKNGSVTYDVSAMTSHTFNAVVGKTSVDWRRMGGGFDRNMFNAAVNVTIALDGVVVEEIKDISMRGGLKAVNIDVSDAKEMTITVKGNGMAPQFEDAVIANAAFVPRGPIVVNFEKADGKATITVLNTDEEYVDVVLTSAENGIITTEAASMGKGLYRTVEVEAGEKAFVKAYVTGIGEIVISNE